MSCGSASSSLRIPIPRPSLVGAGRYHLGKGAGLQLEVTLGGSLGCPGASRQLLGYHSAPKGRGLGVSLSWPIADLSVHPLPQGVL